MDPKRPRLLLGGAALLLILAALLLASCSGPASSPSAESPPSEPWFQDVTEASGVHHTYDNGQDVHALTLAGQPLPDPSKLSMRLFDAGVKLRTEERVKRMEAWQFGHLAILETLGGGAGLIDYDGDGLLDIFLPGGGTYTGPNTRTIVGRPCKLYKNLGNFQFKDVTQEVGLDKIDFYTHGAAVADYNNDGYPDLLVTGWGRLALFRNDPIDPNDLSKGRKFTDVTKAAHLDDHLWSTGAAWADFDGDGHVDLYVAHYVDWHFGKTEAEEAISHPACTYDNITREYCSPSLFNSLPHVLYRNNGDGTFSDVSKSAGLRVPRKEEDYPSLHKEYMDAARERLKGTVADAELESAARTLADDICDRLRQADEKKEYGKGLGVVAVDINGDGKPDVFVACDMVDNLLYVNRSKPGKILFEEMALSAGVARDDTAHATGSMGVDACDYDGSLRPSLWCVNYESENHSLFHNDCAGDRIIFGYATATSGITTIGQQYVGWGTRFVDFDCGGLQHLFVSNGHVILVPYARAKRYEYPVLMQCVEDGRGKRSFKDVTAKHGGAYCAKEHCGRGVAFGDLNNDGRVDLVTVPLDEPIAVLKTVAGAGNHWIGFNLKRKDHRDSVGAKIILEAGGKKQARFAKGGGSYLSANDPRHVFGLGKGDKIDKVTVTWPDLHEQTWEALAVDRYWDLIEGQPEAK